MKVFHCDHCDSLLFFENVRCLSCGHTVGYLPGLSVLSALEPEPDGTWRALDAAAEGARYRQCGNGKQFEVCNWLVRVEDPDPFCGSCKLNVMVPDLKVAGNRERWQKLEQAKRRVIDAVLRMGLSVAGVPGENRPPLRFQFLGTPAGGPAPLTGHEDGLITMNIAEADDDERERRRLRFREPFRTLVGHIRHEIAHYYWDQLIKDTPRTEDFRKVFGDESTGYDGALKAYYEKGSPADWNTRFVTAYASAHPWEDWAETWAHYLHITDTMETAASLGLQFEPESTLARMRHPARGPLGPGAVFDEMIENWVPVTCAINELNRGMGLPDLYPFVVPEPVIEKLRFIHTLLGEVRAGGATDPTNAEPGQSEAPPALAVPPREQGMISPESGCQTP